MLPLHPFDISQETTSTQFAGNIKISQALKNVFIMLIRKDAADPIDQRGWRAASPSDDMDLEAALDGDDDLI